MGEQLELDLSDELTKAVVDKILKDNPHVKLGESMKAPIMAFGELPEFNELDKRKVVTAQLFEFDFNKKIVLPPDVSVLHFFKVNKPTGYSANVTYTFGADQPLHIAFGVS